MPRTFTLVSVSVHAVVLGSVYLVQVFNVGTLPIPRETLAFDERLVKIKDIELPPPPSRSTAAAPAVSPHAAPIEPPSAITRETGLELEAPVTPSTGNTDGLEYNGTSIPGPSVIPGATLSRPAPLPTPPEPVHLHSGIQPPRKIVDVSPRYPELARTARQQGVVILETVIDSQGGVETVRVLKGYPLLDQAAVEAVRQWRFTPALLNGQPVPVVMTVTVNFFLR